MLFIEIQPLEFIQDDSGLAGEKTVSQAHSAEPKSTQITLRIITEIHTSLFFFFKSMTLRGSPKWNAILYIVHYVPPGALWFTGPLLFTGALWCLYGGPVVFIRGPCGVYTGALWCLYGGPVVFIRGPCGSQHIKSVI